jgi:hypothetical protein
MKLAKRLVYTCEKIFVTSTIFFVNSKYLHNFFSCPLRSVDPIDLIYLNSSLNKGGISTDIYIKKECLQLECYRVYVEILFTGHIQY